MGDESATSDEFPEVITVCGTELLPLNTELTHKRWYEFEELRASITREGAIWAAQIEIRMGDSSGVTCMGDGYSKVQGLAIKRAEQHLAERLRRLSVLLGWAQESKS